MSTCIKAVIFDIGGVVLSSPFVAIAQYEREKGLPPNYLNVSITKRGSGGAWQRFERGELGLFDFYKEFGEDLSDTVNGNAWYRGYSAKNPGQHAETAPLPEGIIIDGRELFGRMMKQAQIYDPHIMSAIQKLKATKKHKIIALTNNFSDVPGGEPIPQSELEFLCWQDGAVPDKLKNLFDDFCDSSTLGMRKPEPEFYIAACERNGVEPHEAVFLDDIRMNLKAARELGMKTIHVPIGGTAQAVEELGKTLGLDFSKKETASLARL